MANTSTDVRGAAAQCLQHTLALPPPPCSCAALRLPPAFSDCQPPILWPIAGPAVAAVQVLVAATKQLLEYRNNSGSLSFYMIHGGTNFGFWQGERVMCACSRVFSFVGFFL